LRGPDSIWLLTQKLDIDHLPEPICAAHESSNPLPTTVSDRQARKVPSPRHARCLG
jgi:hypothetical protein